MADTRFLDGTRFLLALWVAVDHFYALIGGPAFYHIPIIGEYILLGSVPVNGFIMITGFLMTYHYYLRADKEPYRDKKTVVNFWVRRFFRLYPVYVLAILSAFALSKLVIYHREYVRSYLTSTEFNVKMEWLHFPSFTDLATHLTFIHGLVDKYSVSLLTPAWSLSLEMQFYLLFPFIFLLFFATKYKRLSIFIPLSVLMYIFSKDLFGLYGGEGLFANFLQPSILSYRLGIFVYGMVLAGVILNKLNLHFLWISIICVFPMESMPTSILVGLITFFMFMDKLNEAEIFNKYIYQWLSIIRGIFSCKVASFGADLSYSLYLTHWIILPMIFSWTITMFSSTFGKYETVFLALNIYLVVCLTISYVLYRTVEKPFINIGKNLLRKQVHKRDKQVSAKTA